MIEEYCFPVETHISELENLRTIEIIYDHLADQISKEIFSNRLLYSLSGDFKFIERIIRKSETGVRLINELEKEDFWYIYGAGIRGARVAKIYSNINWLGYIDQHKSGDYNGYSVKKLEELNTNSNVLVSNLYGSIEICDNLKSRISGKISALQDYDRELLANIYFEKDIFSAGDIHGAFVDMGAYDGIDTAHYFSFMEDVTKTAYVFEPDINNYEMCKSSLENYSNCHVKNCGLSNYIGEAKFSLGKKEASRIVENGGTSVRINTVDNLFKDIRVGYIKMDIEGEELNALKGAEQVIKRDHPILAVSIYHKREDIWEIPKLILDYYQGYKLYLRHYTVGITDTVIYAIP